MHTFVYARVSTHLQNSENQLLELEQAGILAAVSEIERDILIERTQAGLQRAKAEGKRLGRPRTASWDSAGAIQAALAEGVSVSRVAREQGVSRATVIRIRNAWSSP